MNDPDSLEQAIEETFGPAPAQNFCVSLNEKPLVAEIATDLPAPQYEVITPEIAKQYLARNVANNRSVSKSKVQDYVKKMRNGDWGESHQGMAFDVNGRLIDGQHRLHAIVASGITLVVLVARGSPCDTFLRIDQGAVRSTKDHLTIAGHGGVPNLESMAKMVWCFQNDKPTAGPGSRLIPAQLIKIVEDQPGMRAYGLRAHNLQRGLGISKACGGAAAYLCELANPGLDPEILSDWYEGIETGANLGVGDPRLSLREIFRRSKGLSAKEQMTLYVRAWNALLRDERVRFHKAPGPSVPWPVIAKRQTGRQSKAA